MQWRLLACLVPMTFTLLATPAYADIYGFVDKNGVRHLSNVRSDARYKLVMKTPAYRKPPPTQTASLAPSNLYGSTRFYSSNSYWPGSSGAYSAYGSSTRSSYSRARQLSARNENHRQRLSSDVSRIAAQHRLDPALLHAVITAESAYNPWAVSPKGAMGLMQLMPGTAARFGVRDAYDPVANIQGGARYLRWLLDHFNDTRLAVAAYNAGEGAVKKYGYRIPPYRETQNYVVKVLDYYQQYRGSGAYYATGNTGASPLNGGRYYSSVASSSRPNVVVITPRGKRSPTLASTTGSTSGTYFQPSSKRIITGSSRTSAPRVVSAAGSASLFAGNDK